MVEKTKTIRQSEFIPGATPEDVYSALIEARKHAAFTGSPATGASRVGSKFTAWDGYIYVKNLELESGKRILQEWKTTEWPDGPPRPVWNGRSRPKRVERRRRWFNRRFPMRRLRGIAKAGSIFIGYRSRNIFRNLASGHRDWSDAVRFRQKNGASATE